MSRRIHQCPACRAEKYGIKSRLAYVHVCCEFDRQTFPLKKAGNTATFYGVPTPLNLQAVKILAQLSELHVTNKANNL